MPRCLIVYFSQSGTTARVAESIAAGLHSSDYEVDLFNINGSPPPDFGGYDLLGIGSPVYYYRPPFNVSDYLRSMPVIRGLPVFVFMMYGTYRFDTGNRIRRALAGKGAREVGYFHAHGADLYPGYLKEGYLFSPGYPTEEELSQAEEFGRHVAARVEGGEYIMAEADRPPPPIYRFERFALGRWFFRNIYSRLFKADREKCTACGVCIQLCPSGNIVEGRGRRPVWGRNCLLCFTCQVQCPEEAVIWRLGWTLMRPFTIYNARSAARDASVDCSRIDPKSWLRVARGEE
ncbi:MAG: EFR1 family ferrodoxin [Dehalococcoidia bacterium]|nr:MAG: EFR1 family ferrodoxin [Dehalococcoidia bacterium]